MSETEFILPGCIEYKQTVEIYFKNLVDASNQAGFKETTPTSSTEIIDFMYSLKNISDMFSMDLIKSSSP